MSFEEDGREVLIPTVINGKRLTENQAIQYYRKTGQHLGKFDSPKNADAYAVDLHNRQAERMGIGAPKRTSGPQPTWDSIDRQLDQNLPTAQRDKIRNHYFDQYIAPKVRTGYSVEDTRADWLKRTEKPLPPMSERIAGTLVNVAMEGAAFTALSAAFGPLSAGLARTLFGASDAATVAAAIGRGGMAMATVNALEASDGDRVRAGVRGAALGAAWELGVGAVFGFGEKAMRAAEADAIGGVPARREAGAVAPAGGRFEFYGTAPRRPGEPRPYQIRTVIDPTRIPPEPIPELPFRPEPKQLTMGERRAFQAQRVFGEAENKAFAEMQIQRVQDARQKGFLMSPPKISVSRPGLFVSGKDAAGKPFEIAVKKGFEQDAIAQVEQLLEAGGSMDGIQGHTSAQARMTEFLRHFARKTEEDDFGMRLKISPPSKLNAGKVARQMNDLGLRGTVIDEATVRVGPDSPLRKAQQANQRIQNAKKFVATGDKAKLDVAEGQDGKDLFRIGEIRTTLQAPLEARQKAGIPSGKLYDEMHHLQGEIGARHGIRNRADIGQLGLRYFEQKVSGEEVKAADMLKGYPGERGRIGERPPAGNREPSGVLKGYRKAIPANERFTWDPDEQEMYFMEGRVKDRPVGKTKVISQAAEDVGFYGAQIRTPEGPMRVLTKDADKQTMYHEGLHDGGEHAGIRHDQLGISSGARKVSMDIGKGLRRDYPDAYTEIPGHQLLDEAFVHAAEAIRFNDTARLAELGADDTSIPHVKAFVRETAEKALDSIADDTVPLRAYQRRLNDLLRRTTDDITGTLDQASVHGYQTWYDPELGKWVMRDGEGRELWKNELNDVWDEIHNADPTVQIPDTAHTAYFKGFKGPAVPRGTEPNSTIPGNPEIWNMSFGLQALAHVSRPALDWASSIQKIITREGSDFDIFSPIRSLLQVSRRAAARADDMGVDLDKIFKGVSATKFSNYGEVFSRPEAEWAAHSAKLDMDAKDLDVLKKLSAWDKAQVGEGRIGLQDTLTAMRHVRDVSGDFGRVNITGPVADAIKKSHLGESLNVKEVLQWVKRTNYERAIEPELKAYDDAVKEFAKANPNIKYPLANLRRYILGAPDQSQKLLNDFMDGMQNGANRYAAELNKTLPKGLQIPKFDFSSGAWGTMRAVMYMAGLGLRPAVAIRDTWGATQAMMATGPVAFAKGLARAMTKEGRALAEKAGATLHGRSVSQFFGDVSSELPMGGRIQQNVNRLADKLLSPSRMGHNVGRYAAFLGEYDQALAAVKAYRAGAIDEIRLANSTGAWFHDTPEKSRLIALAGDLSKTPEQVATEFGLAVNEATQYGGAPGSMLRTGMGRVFGQYGSWPMNTVEFLRKLVTRAVDTPSKGVPALGMWLASNYAAFEAAKSVGIDATKWLFFSPAGFAGSPMLELAQHIYEAPEETDKGRTARKAILEFPLTEFVPAGVAIQNVLDGIDKGTLSIPRALGFREWKDPSEELDFSEYVRKELGFRPRPQE